MAKRVVLGKIRDYGAGLAHDLVREPVDEHTGISYDSWSGTENDLRDVKEIEAECPFVRLAIGPY